MKGVTGCGRPFSNTPDLRARLLFLRPDAADAPSFVAGSSARGDPALA